MDDIHKKSPNQKVGLVLVKMKLSENGIHLTDYDKLSSCTCHGQWIVVAGNTNKNNFEKTHDCEANHDVNGTSKILPNHKFNDTLLNIVELHLDNVFREKVTSFTAELFKCENVKVLSLRHNNLVRLPVEIGRLSQLRTLILTNNCLTIKTIPFTLTFCTHLKRLYLDENYLDALPGFLLLMDGLKTVYRHGNHNYFKSTFMWYHTAEGERIIPLRPNQIKEENEEISYQPMSLKFFAIKVLIASQINFFRPGLLPVTLQDYVAEVYKHFKICAYCNEAFCETTTGFRVFTFKNPYLGNTCVPFEHWTCSQDCGISLEKPAHKLERIQAQELDKQYQKYIASIQNEFTQKASNKRINSCSIV